MRANAISQSAGGYFEYAVGKKENASDPAPGCRADVQGVLHARAGDADADTVQIGDHGQQREHAEHPVLVFHGAEYTVTRYR